MIFFCTRQDVESLFSVLGVDQRLDDGPRRDGYVGATEESYLEDLIGEASDLILQKLVHRYSPVHLKQCRWIRRTCAYVTCYLLSNRRGNPRQFVSKYDEILDDLDAIAAGTRWLTDDDGNILPNTMELSPTMSNITVDDRYVRRKIRAQEESGVGGPVEGRDADHHWYWGGD